MAKLNDLGLLTKKMQASKYWTDQKIYAQKGQE